MKEFIKNIKFVWQYARDQKSKLVKYILCNLIAVIISVVVPIISAKIIVYLTDSMFYQLQQVEYQIHLMPLNNLHNILLS